jgi:SpoVK/Ycf46/Vps4 family AAA+-type ATPase
MALEILKDIALNLEDLVEELPALKEKVKSVKDFLAYAKQQEDLQRMGPRSYKLKLDDIEGQATSLAQGLRDHYMPPDDVLKRTEQAAREAGPQMLEKFQAARTKGKEVIELVRQLTGKQYAIPSAVVEFVDHAIKVLEEGRVSVFSCKRPVTDLGVSFKQLAGLTAEKEQLKLGYIYPSQYKGLFGGGVSRGVLMFGPPGTGKTLLAKAATAELKDSAFFTATPGEIKGK